MHEGPCSLVGFSIPFDRLGGLAGAPMCHRTREIFRHDVSRVRAPPQARRESGYQPVEPPARGAFASIQGQATKDDHLLQGVNRSVPQEAVPSQLSPVKLAQVLGHVLLLVGEREQIARTGWRTTLPAVPRQKRLHRGVDRSSGSRNQGCRAPPRAIGRASEQADKSRFQPCLARLLAHRPNRHLRRPAPPFRRALEHTPLRAQRFDLDGEVGDGVVREHSHENEKLGACDGHLCGLQTRSDGHLWRLDLAALAFPRTGIVRGKQVIDAAPGTRARKACIDSTLPAVEDAVADLEWAGPIGLHAHARRQNDALECETLEAAHVGSGVRSLQSLTRGSSRRVELIDVPQPHHVSG
mmetsp:Transcript_6048/g.23999  ORF Transcript_6048/g.23999 Transcript_6048/m.23999 type:complete len:354 (-) Transcript_6048:824-1885(-)